MKIILASQNNRSRVLNDGLSSVLVFPRELVKEKKKKTVGGYDSQKDSVDSPYSLRLLFVLSFYILLFC